MELSPIPGIRAVSPPTARRDEREVQPTLGLGPSERMEDDAYHGANQDTERGLEQEDAEAVEEAGGRSDTQSNSSDAISRVNFFA